MALLLDDFNRSDRLLTADGWGQVEGSCSIISGVMGGTVAASENLCYTPDSYGPDMAAFITITTKCADGEGLSFFTRYDTSTFSGYDLQFTAQAGVDNDRFRLFRFDNGSFGPQLGSTYLTEVSAGDQFGIVAEGTSLKCYYKPVGGAWTLIIDVVDTTYQSGGRIAFGAYSNVGRYDNLTGGNDLALPVDAPGPPSITITTQDQTVGFSTASIEITGTAEAGDGETIVSVSCPGETVSGTTAWSATVGLDVGVNSFEFTVLTDGDQTDSATVLITRQAAAKTVGLSGSVALHNAVLH